MKILIQLTAFLIVAFALAGRAGESTAVARTISGDLTLDRAVQIALKQNPEILRQLQEIQRVRGQVIEVRAQALPHLTLTGTFTQQDRELLESGGFGGSSSGGNSSSSSSATGSSRSRVVTGSSADATTVANGTVVGQGGVPVSPTDASVGSSQFSSSGNSFGVSGGGGTNDISWRVSVQATQVIYSGGQVSAALKIAKFTQDSSYYSLRDVVDRIVATVRQQFFTVLLDRALIRVQEESLKLLGDQLADQKNRYDAGTVPRFNVLQAEVALSTARPEYIRAKNNSLIAQLQLAKTLGLEPTPGGKPSFNAVGDLSVPQRALAINSALAAAKERRPFLKVQRQNILIEAEQIKVELAGYKPRLNVNGGYEVHNSRLTDSLDDVVNGWFYGVTGSWNIFDGFETYGRVKQARARLESAKINYDDSVLQVELEVQQAFANLQQAKETIQSQQKTVEQALEALRLAQERLSAGAGTQLDVLDARVALTRARTTELQARSDYNVALADFDRVTATDTVYDENFHDPLSARERRKPAPAKDPQPARPPEKK